MSKAAATLKPEELAARLYADRLILEQLTELSEVFKPSEIADRLKSSGLGLSTVRSLLASNPNMFAYSERRWVPAARVEGAGRPFSEQIRLITERFGGPMPLELLAREAARATGRTEEWCTETVQRLAKSDPHVLITRDQHVVNRKFVFAAADESIEDAFALNHVDAAAVEAVEKKLGDFDWHQTDAIMAALEKTAPVNAKALAAAAWKVLNPQDPQKPLLMDWKEFSGELLSIPGFILAADGSLYPEKVAENWITTAVRLADKIAPTIEVEDAAPLELKGEDVEKMIGEIAAADEAVTATKLLETHFEITPQVRTFPDDMANIMRALRADKRVEWVGGDRFMKPNQAPEYIFELPEPFQFVRSEQKLEDGEFVDSELIDEGLNTSLRKLISHPLATDVLDEEILPSAKVLPETLRLVLKPIHRELGTFPLSQFPAGWFEEQPNVQEFILINPEGEKLQVWINHELRIIFGLFDWWLEQPVESGAVFSLTKTPRPNVLEFAWLDQTDPVVYISNQRMEELREIAGRAEELSTFDIVREVMTHWPKGADFLTILWEVNVVRRTSRRLLASLLSSYVCFYQRSGSPVWHYDHKKVEQGFDKSKKKFIKKD